MAEWATGHASKWFLHHALAGLNTDLRALGGQLILRTGDSLEVLREIVEATGAQRVVWNRRYEGALREIDAMIKRKLRASGVEVESFNSSLLNEPHTVSTGGGKPYKVYTPYWKRVKDRALELPVDVDIARLSFLAKRPTSLPLADLGLLPEISWDKKFHSYWEVSEASAQKCLQCFIGGPVDGYATDRDIPSVVGTSSLSPYLHWGLLGPRQIMAALIERGDLHKDGPGIYAKEIYWREFAYNVLYHFPRTPDEALQIKYRDFPWQSDCEIVRCWQRGLTGYPIVDAGMRQLYETGWMHNRVRMIVSSFLVKHLLQDWREGARWFWDTLVDADLASNTLGWQWSAGCGADAAPYFRIFNPMTQGQKFDPDGDYVRKWVPELAKLPNKYIHEPWEAPMGILEHAGVELGENYPKPVIEHKKGRERALTALATLK
jgi:deoxyribodipyrimidine photo-lyase